MDSDTIWQHIDEQRLELAALIDSLTSDQLSSPSLCTGWTVRDVAVHLTQSHAPPSRVLLEALRSGFRFNTMIHQFAIRDRTSAAEAAEKLRRMVGSRRRPLGTNERTPLLDTLLHGQDIAVPLGIDRPVPPDAAAAAAECLWDVSFPFHARRRHPGIRFVATDVEFAAGSGRVAEAPIRDIIMLLSGRTTAAGILAPRPTGRVSD